MKRLLILCSVVFISFVSVTKYDNITDVKWVINDKKHTGNKQCVLFKGNHTYWFLGRSGGPIKDSLFIGMWDITKDTLKVSIDVNDIDFKFKIVSDSLVRTTNMRILTQYYRIVYHDDNKLIIKNITSNMLVEYKHLN